MKLSKLLPFELDELEQRVFSKIDFINEFLIPKHHIQLAENLTFDIDLDDTPFVALTEYLDGKLWTNDNELTEGLADKNYRKTISTEQLYYLHDNFE